MASKQFHAVFAEESVLQKFSCVRDENDKCDILTLSNGWKFSSFHSKIPNEHEHLALSTQIKKDLSNQYVSIRNEHACEGDFKEWLSSDSLTINQFKLKIPPMIFIHDIMRMSFAHENKERSQISIRADDALLCWIAQHTAENEAKKPVQVIKVPFAKDWTNRHIENTNSGFMNDIHNQPITVGNNVPPQTSPSSVFISTPSPPSTAAAASSTSVPPTAPISAVSEQQSSVKISTLSKPYDWTLSSDYCCTVASESASDGKIVLSARALAEFAAEQLSKVVSNSAESTSEKEDNTASGADGTEANVDNNSAGSSSTSGGFVLSRAERSGIDLDLLKDRDAPILFYDEFLLYQDDLDDSGEVLFEAKLRVMPACWFLLSKFYLRVDGVLTRCRETRLFHKFSNEESAAPVVVHMEVLWREIEVPPPVSAAPATENIIGASRPMGGVTGGAYSGGIPPGSLSSIHSSVSGNSGSAGSSGGAMHPALLKMMGAPGPGGSTRPLGPPGMGGVNSSSARPVHVQSNAESKQNTHLLPIVNDKEYIHQYFTLTI